MNKNEEDRIVFNILEGQKPDGYYIEFTSHSGVDCLDKIRQVVQIISKYNKETWPSYVKFREELPEWFVQKILQNSITIIEKNPEKYLWNYESWIDALKYRNWYWWSCETIGDGWSIILNAVDSPLIIEPFEYIIRESGVDNYTFHEKGVYVDVKQKWKLKNGGNWIYQNI